MKQQTIGNQWALIAKDIPGRTENQVKNRYNSLIKKIREEKTFLEGLKSGGLQEVLGDLGAKHDGRKLELEDQWIKELIKRKREEIDRVEELKEGMQEVSNEETPEEEPEEAEDEEENIGDENLIEECEPSTI